MNKLEKNEMLKHIGSACKKLRKRAHMTQEQVGDLVGYSPMYICNFEHGREDSAILLYTYITKVKYVVEKYRNRKV